MQRKIKSEIDEINSLIRLEMEAQRFSEEYRACEMDGVVDSEFLERPEYKEFIEETLSFAKRASIHLRGGPSLFLDVGELEELTKLYVRHRAMLSAARKLHNEAISLATKVERFARERGLTSDEKGEMYQYVLWDAESPAESDRRFKTFVKKWKAAATPKTASPINSECLEEKASAGSAPHHEATSQPDLEKEASEVRTQKARRLYEAGLKASSDRERLRFFRKAIHAEQNSLENKPGEEEREQCLKKDYAGKQKAETAYISFQEIARGKLELVREIAEDGTWQTAREVLLALATKGRIGNCYLPMGGVVRFVRNKADVTCMRRAVNLLVREGIIISHNKKAGDTMLSLSPRASDGKSPAARKIITAILSLKRE